LRIKRELSRGSRYQEEVRRDIRAFGAIENRFELSRDAGFSRDARLFCRNVSRSADKNLNRPGRLRRLRSPFLLHSWIVLGETPNNCATSRFVYAPLREKPLSLRSASRSSYFPCFSWSLICFFSLSRRFARELMKTALPV
jgi:hypothetical protein